MPTPSAPAKTSQRSGVGTSICGSFVAFTLFEIDASKHGSGIEPFCRTRCGAVSTLSEVFSGLIFSASSATFGFASSPCACAEAESPAFNWSRRFVSSDR